LKGAVYISKSIKNIFHNINNRSIIFTFKKGKVRKPYSFALL